MSTRTPLPFFASVLVHAAVGGVMAWLMLRAADQPPLKLVEPAKSFIVTPSGPGVANPPSSAAPGAGRTSVTFTPPPPLPPVRQPAPQQEIVESAPPPPPPARITPPPRPPRDRPVTPPAVPTTSNPTTSVKTPPQTTLQQHRALHGTPSTNPPAAVPQINVNEVLQGAPGAQGPRSGAPSAGPGSSAPSGGGDADEQATYFGKLLAKLREVHEKPAGLSDELQAQVGFTLQPDGSLTAVRILKSSGDAAFDASVLAAFRRVGGLGKPPRGAVGASSVTFRVRAD